jgi:hypothetical protein
LLAALLTGLGLAALLLATLLLATLLLTGLILSALLLLVALVVLVLVVLVWVAHNSILRCWFHLAETNQWNRPSFLLMSFDTACHLCMEGLVRTVVVVSDGGADQCDRHMLYYPTRQLSARPVDVTSFTIMFDNSI